MTQRKIEVAVISDVHLGTYGCHAHELNIYLRSIDPGTLILNGDLIDIWHFKKKYWPDDHTRVIHRILKMAANGTKIYYITGNHDESLRKYSGTRMGRILLCDKLVLMLDGKLHWFFHGDVFDLSMQHAKWLAKLGGKSYDWLIRLNRFINKVLEKTGREKISMSKYIKNKVKKAVSFISNFENMAAQMAAENGYDAVVCGHIHQPEQKMLHTGKKEIHYLNSGDWVENLSALEYEQGKWSLRYFSSMPEQEINDENEDHFLLNTPSVEQVYEEMMIRNYLRKKAG